MPTDPRIILLVKTAGAHIHTANKCAYYYDGWRDKTIIDNAIDKALVGDWKPLQQLLQHLW